ncbi:MAG: type 2 lantipeptide synthetase LanM [Wenzhouxiangellaceae bacterium]|nr:MAG: type 2 lantipeptide synthetase LanM [Wenzhouxiangellaceae bacterium]
MTGNSRLGTKPHLNSIESPLRHPSCVEPSENAEKCSLAGHFADNYASLATAAFGQRIQVQLKLLTDRLRSDAKAKAIVNLASLEQHLCELLTESSVRSLSLAILKLFQTLATAGAETLNTMSPEQIELTVREHGYEWLACAYPELDSLLQARLNLLASAIADAVRHFQQDRDQLTQLGLTRDDQRLIGIRALGEESHDRGRHPLLLEFEGGHSLVYKPRSLGMEATWQWALGELTQQTGDPLSQQPALLDCNSHGWMQTIVRQAAKDDAALERYFQRFGLQLALAHAMGVGDLHSENVIAVGDEPVMIDCEVFVGLDLPWYDQATRSHFATVLGTGLLPWTIVSRGSPTLNRAGIATGPHITEQHWQGEVDAEGLLQAVRVDRITATAHSPFRPDSTPDWRRLGTALARGYEHGYRALLEPCRARRFQQQLLKRLKDQSVRILPRTTHHYSQLLMALNSPAGLARPEQRAGMLDKLELATPHCPGIEALIPAERSSLEKGDVPAFGARLGSRTLFWEGKPLAPAFFPPGSENAPAQRLAQMNEADLARQLRLIEESFAEFKPPRLPPTPARSPSCRTTAQALGQLILDAATRGHWFEANHNGTYASLSRIDYSLEKGTSGLALLFAGLAAAGSGQHWASRARTLLQDNLDLPADTMAQSGAGGHAGLGGQIFTLCASARLLDEPVWVERARTLLPLLHQALLSESRMDLMAGCAGGLLAALELYRMSGDPSALECARLARRRLTAAQLASDDGAAWPSCTEADRRPLTGMAHGSSGIRMALARLQTIDPAADIPELLAQAARFEQRQHDWQHGGAVDGCGEAWCRGTLGVGLAWSEQQAAMGTVAPNELIRAMPGACLHFRSDNDSLCHGRLGNLLMLRRLRRHWPSSTAAIDLEHAISDMLAEINQGEVICGSQPRREVYGLMAGMAGIAYGLLMLEQPDWPDPLILKVSP